MKRAVLPLVTILIGAGCGSDKAARREEGCYGARMTGGGFAGCAVALVDADKAERFATAVAGTYQNSTGLTPAIYVCHATNGAEVIV